MCCIAFAFNNEWAISAKALLQHKAFTLKILKRTQASCIVLFCSCSSLHCTYNVHIKLSNVCNSFRLYNPHEQWIQLDD